MSLNTCVANRCRFAVAAVVACSFVCHPRQGSASVFAVACLQLFPQDLFFLVKPLQQELMRNHTRKPNKNNGLAAENNLP
jgi:hypothetical protein